MILGTYLVLSRDLLFSIAGFLLVLYSTRKLLEEFSTEREPRRNTNDFSRTIIREIYGFSNRQKLGALLSSALIHIAKADGRISEEEVSVIKINLIQNFGGEINELLIRRIAALTQEEITFYSIDELFTSLVQLANLIFRYLEEEEKSYRTEFTAVFFTSLYEVILADGFLTFQKEEIYSRLYREFDIPEGYIKSIKTAAFYNHNQRINRFRNSKFTRENADFTENNYTSSRKLQESLRFFNLNENFTPDDLDKAWKKIVIQYHPDKFHNSDPKTYQEANKKFLEAKDHFDYLKKYRSKDSQ